MSTLYLICIDYIIDSNSKYKTLPNDILDDINKRKLQRDCGNAVSYMLNNEACQYNFELLLILKKLTRMNSKSYENTSRTGQSKIGYLRNPLMIYYMTQESDFHHWFNKDEWLAAYPSRFTISCVRDYINS